MTETDNEMRKGAPKLQWSRTRQQLMSLVVCTALLATIWYGLTPSERCKTETCRELSDLTNNRIQISEWPFSAVDKTSLVKLTPAVKLTQMIEEENFSKEYIAAPDKKGTDILRYRKHVRDYFFLYVPIGGDQLVLDFVGVNGVVSVRAAWLIAESVGNL